VRFFSFVTVVYALVLPALAQEPVGCDKFRWSLDKERATLTGTDLPKVASGSEVKWPLPFATMVALVPLVDAKLPIAPERSPKSQDTFGGSIQIGAPIKAGTIGSRYPRRAGLMSCRMVTGSDRRRRPVRPVARVSAKA
jgi:hypothetical protein